MDDKNRGRPAVVGNRAIHEDKLDFVTCLGVLQVVEDARAVSTPSVMIGASMPRLAI